MPLSLSKMCLCFGYMWNKSSAATVHYILLHKSSFFVPLRLGPYFHVLWPSVSDVWCSRGPDTQTRQCNTYLCTVNLISPTETNPINDLVKKRLNFYNSQLLWSECKDLIKRNKTLAILRLLTVWQSESCCDNQVQIALVGTKRVSLEFIDTAFTSFSLTL